MENGSTVTFVIPAYNASKYIADAIESVLYQTVSNWKLIIVDDCSTDDTLRLARQYAEKDNRINVITMPVNSGSAFTPRNLGIKLADTDWIAPLDADDWILPTYLEELLKLQSRTDADAVYPTMQILQDDETIARLPEKIEEENSVKIGKECVVLTINGWKINCNGGIIKRKYYLEAIAETENEQIHTFSDEMLERYLLYMLPRVAFSPVPYFFRDNADSITRSPSVKKFDYLNNNTDLLKFTLERFGKESYEYLEAQKLNFYGIFEALMILNQHHFSATDKKAVYELIKRSTDAVEIGLLRGEVSPRFFQLYKSGLPISRIALRIKSLYSSAKPYLNPKKFAGNLGRKYGGRLFGKIRGVCYSFIEDLRQNRIASQISKRRYPKGSAQQNFLEKNYTSQKFPTQGNFKAGVFCLSEGRLFQGGLTDRLRGILTTYEESKKLNLPFYIHWTHPFNLEDFLEPSYIDWRVDDSEIVYSTDGSFPLIIQDLPDRYSSWRMNRGLKHGDYQIHVYSDAENAKGRYRELYHELFKPTEMLDTEVNRHLKILGNDFEAFTFRFLRLLGDFNDWLQVTLPPRRKAELIDRVTNEYLRLTQHISPDKKILITTDSITFARHIAHIDKRAYVTEGSIKNIDLDKGDFKDAWTKTFIDQQLLMYAKKVTLMRTDRMYSSGFPKFAAEIGGARFIEHVF